MKLKAWLASAALASALALGAATAACATVVTFDDLPDDGVVADGYGGVTWAEQWAYYAEPDPDGHYTAASGSTRVYSNPLTVGCCAQDDTIFYFAAPATFGGAYFAGYGEAFGFGPITFGLYRNGALVHTSASLDATGTPQFLAAGYDGAVDEVRVNGPLEHFVMDDVTYTAAAVPEPAGWLLMIAGFGLVGGLLRRRRIAPA